MVYSFSKTVDFNGLKNESTAASLLNARIIGSKSTKRKIELIVVDAFFIALLYTDFSVGFIETLLLHFFPRRTGSPTYGLDLPTTYGDRYQTKAALGLLLSRYGRLESSEVR